MISSNYQFPNRKSELRYLIKRYALSLLVPGITAAFFIGALFITLQFDPSNASAVAPKVDDALAKALASAGEDDYLDIIVYATGSRKINAAQFPEGKIQRRVAVFEQLHDSARVLLADLTQQLTDFQSTGHVQSYRSLWIINAVQATASVEAIELLLARPDVDKIILDQKYQFLEPVKFATSTPAQSITPTWGLKTIRADYVWEGLNIRGEGVTVAVMDTGVDWTHPILTDNYRGWISETPPDHVINWYDAVDNLPEPADPHGHGTHVAGTAVGAQGIGVAPGAQWIAVRVLDENGFGQLGDVHAGFQWLLAPGGDPSKSPDIVNNSWSGSPMLADFIPDVAVLQDAGIIPIFAAGNSGPFPQTIGTPGGYAHTIAVGASDDLDQTTWFSSRGPAYFTDEYKPTFVAPGAYVFSSIPGSQYAYFNGTSMATPHASGLYALLLSAQPSLAMAEISQIITSTAVSIEGNNPNYSSGWGRIDAYDAVSTQAPSGIVQGQVTGSGFPLVDATIVITTSNGYELPFYSDNDGRFQVALSPGIFWLSASKFGYSRSAAIQVDIQAGQLITSSDFELNELPHGQVEGTLSGANDGNPISGTLTIQGTPIVLNIGDSGHFLINLPIGTYSFDFSSIGHKSEHVQVQVEAGLRILPVALVVAPKILFVDSGNWYYLSQRAYYTQALHELNLSYDIWSVRNPFADVPTLEDLIRYDAIIWSAPLDSPGYIGAGLPLAKYLEQGGNLLISGQDIGQWESIPTDPQYWWLSQLDGRYLGDSSPPFEIAGAAEGIFSDLIFELNGPGSADNQESPERSSPAEGSLTEIAFRYADGFSAGLYAGRCEPYHIVYLGFGLEGISSLETRAEIVDRSIKFFEQPPKEVGLISRPAKWDQLVATGKEYDFQFKLSNLSETLTDTIQLSLKDSDWTTSILTESLVIGPCETAQANINITIPEDLPKNSISDFSIVARSTNFPAYEIEIPVRLKTAGDLLIVDDDLFYDREEVYRKVLTDLNIEFDLWDTKSPPIGHGSPPVDLLNQYEYIIWYTGYDWFRPITQPESAALSSYLSQGGRLFLTSQDFMYYHSQDPLTRDYLGLLDFQESVSPENILGTSENGIGLGLVGLNYAPYQNFSDGLVPGPGASELIQHDRNGVAAIGNTGFSWRSVFWAFPFETLPIEKQTGAMRQILGWLSDLGDSNFTADKQQVSKPDLSNPITYTIQLTNQSSISGNQVTITNTLPISILLDESSLVGGGIFDSISREITWSGFISANQYHEISYQAWLSADLEPGTLIINPVEINYDQAPLPFFRTADVWIGLKDQISSTIEIHPSIIRPGQLATLTLHLNNPTTKTISSNLIIWLPEEITPITPTLSLSTGNASWEDLRIEWNLEISPTEIATATFVFTAPEEVRMRWLPITLFDHDQFINRKVFKVTPYQYFYPFVANTRKF